VRGVAVTLGPAMPLDLMRKPLWRDALKPAGPECGQSRHFSMIVAKGLRIRGAGMPSACA